MAYPDNVLARTSGWCCTATRTGSASSCPCWLCWCQRRWHPSVRPWSAAPSGIRAKQVVWAVIAGIWLILVVWLTLRPFLAWLTTTS